MGSPGRFSNQRIVGSFDCHDRWRQIRLGMLRNVPGAICLAVLITGVARPAEAAPLKWRPAGNWVVEFADQQCIASHLYNNGADELTVALKPRPTTEASSVWLRVPKSGPRLDRAQVAVGEASIEDKGPLLRHVDEAGLRYYEVQLTGAELLRLIATGQLRVTAGAWAPDLALPRLAEVQRILDNCVADLLSSWGMSAQAQTELASFPVPERNIASYVSNGDYPTTALERRAMGQVEARVTVTPDGKASDCQMVRSSGHDDLDQITCRVVVKRARFKPARDREGHAMSSPFLFTIWWLMPSG